MNFFKRLFKFGGSDDFGPVMNVVVSLIGFVVIILGWHYVSANEIVPSKVLPDPFKMVSAIPTLYSENHLLGNAWFTIRLNLMCYVYAILLSFPIGFAIGCVPVLRKLFATPLVSARYLPLTAATGLFISLWGLTFEMKIWFLTICIMVFIIPSIVNTINELQDPKNDKDNVYLQTMKTLGASSWQKFRYVYFPYVTGNVAATICDLCAVSYTYCVIAELIYKDGDIMGIGALIALMIRRSAIPEAFVLLFLIVIIGTLQDRLFKALCRKLFPYKTFK